MRLRFWRRDVKDARNLADAQQALRKVRRQWPEVEEAARTMQRHREVNNFAHKIRVAMGVED